MGIGVHHAKALPHRYQRNADWAVVPPARVFDWTTELIAAERACCCSAIPAVTVLLPAHDLDTEPAALLLCGHHYRLCREALRARGAEAYDRDGRQVTDDRWLVT